MEYPESNEHRRGVPREKAGDSTPRRPPGSTTHDPLMEEMPPFMMDPLRRVVRQFHGNFAERARRREHKRSHRGRPGPEQTRGRYAQIEHHSGERPSRRVRRRDGCWQVEHQQCVPRAPSLPVVSEVRTSSGVGSALIWGVPRESAGDETPPPTKGIRRRLPFWATKTCSIP